MALEVASITESLVGKNNNIRRELETSDHGIVHTRANLRIRLFSFAISVLFHSSTLQTVENRESLRSVEEGVSVIPFNTKGLIKLHIVIFELV